MDDKTSDRAFQAAKREAAKQIDTSSTKKRKTAKTAPSVPSARSARSARPPPSTPPPPSACVDKDAGTQPHETSSTKRLASHAGLITETKILASDMVNQIAAETRGVSRKNIPWDKFRSMYLCDLDVKTKTQAKLTLNSVKKIGQANWGEQLFWNRLRQSLSDEVLCDLKLFRDSSKTLLDANMGKEVQTKPDFVLHVGEEPPTWADVEFLFERTRSRGHGAVTKKFMQWLCGAWSVFHHQPFRRHLYGIMFIQPFAYVCYTDHGCAVYSEPLDFVKNNQHTQFLVDFLTGFIANPECRGRDPTVTVDELDNRIHIRHAGTTWTEPPIPPLCYRPCLVGRHIRGVQVQEQGTKFPTNTMVMKSAWEENLPPASSPPSEVEVLKILMASVRGLPQPYALESAIVRDDGNSETETRGFPENCEVALPAATANLMRKMQASNTSKPLVSGANVDRPPIRRVKIERQQFNKPLEIRRRLTRILMSYCVPLKEAMRYGGPNSLMRTIRDAMIVYYEAYKLPESGFIHGDISIENILVPVETGNLTGGLTYKDRRGTLIDWNLCFTTDGTSSNRSFRSGTPAFMAPALLDDDQIPRRTLAHDMESFFAVIIWIASLDYTDDAAFRAKPLVSTLLDPKKARTDIANTKGNWLNNPDLFRMRIVNYFEPFYREDMEWIKCLIKLRKILYPLPNQDELKAYMASGPDNNETEDADPMKEGLFRTCMKAIDNYLGETKGCGEMQWIDSQALKRHTLEILN